MPSILSGVSVGSPRHVGQRIVVAAAEGSGKTTLACGAPNVLLVPLEMGFGSMQIPHVPLLDRWENVIQLCEELRSKSQAGGIAPGSSIAWDSATALERLIHDYVIRQDPGFRPGNKTGITMESALGGYGKAYNFANEEFGRWTRYADELAKYGGINTIVTCHVFASKVIDPAHGEYMSWDLLLHSPKNEKTYGKREFITQWADMIGFLHEPMFVQKGDQGQMTRAISANQGRVVAVDRKPGWVAKNRYNMSGTIAIPAPPANAPLNPATLAHGWNALAQPIYNATGIDLFNRAGN